MVEAWKLGTGLGARRELSRAVLGAWGH